jgi:hypothetical protein
MRTTKWWRRPWIFPLGALVAIFLAFSLPPYLSMDPGRSRVPQPESLGVAHYWTLVPHVLFGSIALATAVLQIWPWLRRTHPAWHRRAGRLYVFGGVLPAGLTALVVGFVRTTAAGWSAASPSPPRSSPTGSGASWPPSR